MEKSLNSPYVKKFNNEGKITNPIRISYVSKYPNRKQRREYLNQKPFTGTGKNTPMTVVGISKYYRVLQLSKDKKTGELKKIEHYLIRNW